MNTIKEFREKFSGISYEAFDAFNKNEDVEKAKRKAIETFILKALKDQKSEIIKEIEGMKKRLDVYCGCGKLRERQMDGLTFCPKLKKETKTINFDASHKALEKHPTNPWGSVEDLIVWETLKDIIKKI